MFLINLNDCVYSISQTRVAVSHCLIAGYVLLASDHPFYIPFFPYLTSKPGYNRIAQTQRTAMNFAILCLPKLIGTTLTCSTLFSFHPYYKHLLLLTQISPSPLDQPLLLLSDYGDATPVHKVRSEHQGKSDSNIHILF